MVNRSGNGKSAGTGTDNGTGTSVITSKDAALDDRDWGPVLDDDVITISLPNKRHDWVSVKRYITEDDDAAASQAATVKGVELTVQANANRAARRAAAKDADSATNKQTFHYDTNAFRSVLLQRMIRDWSFKDRSTGAPLPITARSIGALPTFTRDYIMEKIDEMNPVADLVDLTDVEELDQHGQNTGPLDAPTSVSS